MFNYGFVNPFKSNHCIVLALAHLANVKVEGARALARQGKALGLLDGKGSGRCSSAAQREKWFEVAGLKTIELLTTPKKEILVGSSYITGALNRTRHNAQVTVARFVKEHLRGRWFVHVRAHALAVIDGTCWGYYKPHSLIDWVARVEIIGPMRNTAGISTTKILGPVARVWKIANMMAKAPRRAVIAHCVAQGININTAQTQYSKWRKAQAGG